MLARQKGNITQREIEWILILKLEDSFIEHVAPDLTSETLHRDKRLSLARLFCCSCRVSH